MRVHSSFLVPNCIRIVTSAVFALLVIWTTGIQAEGDQDVVAESAAEEVPTESAVTPVAETPTAEQTTIEQPVEAGNSPQVTKVVMPPPAPISEAVQPSINAQGNVSENSGTAPGNAKSVVSNGSRVNIEASGFSITPPEGWEVRLDVGNAPILMEAQKQAGTAYQRSVQVMAFKGPKFIDSTTAKEIEQLLVRKFSESSAAIEDYRIRNNTDIEMADGRKGILFYSEFKFDGTPLMQAHVLVSSRTGHLIATYTDLAEHFEREENQAFLAEAWATMTSLELDSSTPGRFEGPIAAGVAIFVISGFLGVFFLVRYRMARKRYEDLAASDLSVETAVSSAHSTLNSNIVTLSDSGHGDADDDDIGDIDDVAMDENSNVTAFSKAESNIGSKLDSRITGKAG